MQEEQVRNYPETRSVGGKQVTLRYMTAGDREAILAFARSLPEHDLLFLRRDITQEGTVDSWIQEVELGQTITVLALVDGSVAGYATVERNRIPWTSHVGELRITIAPSMRNKGLGRILTREAFAIALQSGIEKMVAQMTIDQKAAVAVFEGLGFRPEALLRDHVKDRAGKKHDLLILSHEVANFEAEQHAYGIGRAFGR